MHSEELIVPSDPSFQEEFIKKYTDGLLSNNEISDVQITESFFTESPDSYDIIFSGQITSEVGPDSIQTNFATHVFFLESQTYSLTLNSSTEDYQQSLEEFGKSIETFEILSDSMKEKPDQTQKNKEKKEKK